MTSFCRRHKKTSGQSLLCSDVSAGTKKDAKEFRFEPTPKIMGLFVFDIKSITKKIILYNVRVLYFCLGIFYH